MLKAAAALGGFIAMHAFDTQPQAPDPRFNPTGYRAGCKRLCAAYARAYRDYFKQHCPDNGVPARFAVHVVDVPVQAASCELYATALYQRGSLQLAA